MCRNVFLICAVELKFYNKFIENIYNIKKAVKTQIAEFNVACIKFEITIRYVIYTSWH